MRGILEHLVEVTQKLVALQQDDSDLALAYATLYLDVFGRVAAGWM